MPHTITGLDIGTNSIKTVVAEISKNNKVKILSAFKRPSAGLRKGAITDCEEASELIRPALIEAKNVSKKALKNIFINIGGSQTNIQSSKGIVAVSRADNEIYKDDIERVIKTSQTALNLSPNRTPIHTIVRDFIIDGMPNIEDPLGLLGSRLEVNTLIIDTFTPQVNNITQVIERNGGIIGGLVYTPLASARSVMSKNQKELGAVLINIGAGTTSMCVYEECQLLHAKIFPIGASNITNDLAVGLKIPISSAEVLKISFGYALSREINARETIDLKKIDSQSKSTVSKKFFSEIIEVRLAEIFEFINNELKQIGKEGQLPAGAILVGGGSKIPGIIELAKQELKLPVQMGMIYPETFEFENKEVEEKIEDPDFATSLGLVLSGYDGITKQYGYKLSGSGFQNLIKTISKYFTP